MNGTGQADFLRVRHDSNADVWLLVKLSKVIPMAEKPKRQKAISRMNLSDHTLDINIRKCNYGKFDFREIAEYVQ